jgi:ABC-type lipoprotein release transport system permease subunit
MPLPAPRRAAPPGLLFFLALRGLWSGPLTAVLMIAAVAAGVGFQIPNTANLMGYTAELLAQGIASGLGEVRVRPGRGLVFDDGEAVAERIRRVPGVRAAAAVLVVSGSVTAAGRELGGVIYGVDPRAPRQPYRLLSGAPLEPGDAEGALLGVGLSTRLGVSVGDVVELRAILAGGGGLSPAAADLLMQACALGLPVDCSRAADAVRLRRITVRVRGVVGGVFNAYEAAFIDLGALRAESKSPRGASMVLAYSDDPAGAPGLAARVGAAVPEARAFAWMEDSQYLKSSVDSVAAIAAVSHAMVVSAVVIPVWALLYVNVQSRRREVGVLAALGLSRAEIFAAFLVEALIVGTLGALLGCGIGYGLVRWFSAHPIFDWYGFVIRPAVSARSFVEPALVVLGATLFAGVTPALRAARLDPARVLRSL